MEGTALDFLRELKKGEDETWQVGVDRLHTWVRPPEGRPFRPRIVTCLNVDRKEAVSYISWHSDEGLPAVMERVLDKAGRTWRRRPGRFQTDHPAAGIALREALTAHTLPDLPVEDVPELPAVHDVQASLQRRHETREWEDSPPSLLTGDGVTLAQIEAFARSSADFLAAAPWRLLGADLVQIEEPSVEPALRCFSLHETSKGRAIRFFRDAASQDSFLAGETLETLWVLFFEPLWKTPPSDWDLWERQELPRWGEDELVPCPVVLRAGALEERPDARQLAFFEGLLKALAASSESEMDAGRWQKEVATHLGNLRIAFSLPELLEAAASDKLPWSSEDEEDGDEDGADPDPEERLEELLEAAEEMDGRRRALYARRALEIRPDCAEALVLLGSVAQTPERSLELYERAKQIAEQALGPEFFLAGDEADWSRADASDYVLARQAMAEALREIGRLAEAADHWTELIRLDPTNPFLSFDDPIALRIELNQDAEAAALLEGYIEEGPGRIYMKALLAFRWEGDTPETRRILRAAVRENPSVPGFLLDRSRPPRRFGSFESVKAHSYATSARRAWMRTPGALTWLAEKSGLSQSPAPPSPSRPAQATPSSKGRKRNKKRKEAARRRAGKKKRRR